LKLVVKDVPFVTELDTLTKNGVKSSDEAAQDRLDGEVVANPALPLESCHEQLSWQAHGVGVKVDGLTASSLPIASALAMLMTKGHPPPDGGLETFRLQRHKHINGAHLLVSSGSHWFNFLIQKWQKLACVSKYAGRRRQILYAAFVPQDDALLFLKFGFYTLKREGATGTTSDELISYLEKKTKKLSLTNVSGAGVFVMTLPTNHKTADFSDVAKAAEESLKSILCDASELRVEPTGCQGDDLCLASSEYLWVRSSASNLTPLQSLTQVLRGFSGDPMLEPQCAIAQRRGGRKSLVPWGQGAQSYPWQQEKTEQLAQDEQEEHARQRLLKERTLKVEGRHRQSKRILERLDRDIESYTALAKVARRMGGSVEEADITEELKLRELKLQRNCLEAQATDKLDQKAKEVTELLAGSPVLWKPGDIVELSALRTRRELNGRIALVVQPPCANSEAVTVSLEDDCRQLKVNTEHVLWRGGKQPYVRKALVEPVNPLLGIIVESVC
jgi:hypothetical protein